MPAPKTQNINWISNLRLIALYAIIIVHASAPLLEQYNKGPLYNWLVADFYNALVRFGVPVFVMITGALLLPKDYELIGFLKKRFLRILTPFLFWSLVYIWYMYYNEEIDMPDTNWLLFKQVLHFLRDGSSYHLWYVYMLIGLYLTIPIISKFVRNATETEIRYFLLVWLLVMVAGQPYLERFKIHADFRYFEGYIGYLVLGHYLATKQQFLLAFKNGFIGLFILLLVGGTVGTWLLYQHFNGISTYLYEPLSPTILLMAVSVFAMGMAIVPKAHPALIRLRDFVGQYAYGIYLGHALILTLLDQYLNISFKWFNPLFSIPLTALICMVLTFGMIFALNKIPVVGKYISG